MMGAITVAVMSMSARGAEPVDLMLLLAIDVSQSIDDPTYDVQHRGTFEALRDPVVFDAIEACLPGGLAVGYAEWGSRRYFKGASYMIEPFVKIDAREDLLAFADRIASRGRSRTFSSTDPGGAIEDGVAALAAAPFEAPRRTIDVSSDGMQGPRGPNGESELEYLTNARDEAVRRRVTINALLLDPFGTEYVFGDGTRGTLEAYWQKYVIGGPGAFTINIKKPVQFRDALVRKLRREMCEATS